VRPLRDNSNAPHNKVRSSSLPHPGTTDGETGGGGKASDADTDVDPDAGIAASRRREHEDGRGAEISFVAWHLDVGTTGPATMGDRRIIDGYAWDSFLPNSRTFFCRSERFFITAVFLI
jgi:hypothetical protein